jgi:hypothetical protein
MPKPRPPRAASRRLAPYELAGIAAITLLGTWIRVGGLTARDPWFDDAWVVLTGRYGLHSLLRLSATAPGYDLGLTLLWGSRHDTWLVQLPELVLGLIGIVAVFALVRWFRCREPIPLVAALVVATSPVAAAYSTRLKPYAFDLVVACLLLALAERWRRNPTPRALGWLGAASVLVLGSEAATTVLVGVGAMVVLAAIGRPALRRQAAAAAGWLVVLVAVVWELSLRRLPASLSAFWRLQGALLATESRHAAAFSLQQMGSGFLGGLVPTPVQYPTGTSLAPLRGGELALAAACFAALAVLCAVPLLATLRSRARDVHPGTASALAVAAGFVAALLGRAPFGGGRTDEVLYPAVLLLAALAAETVADRATVAAPRWARWGVVAAACAALAATTLSARPAYPTSDVRGVARTVLHRLEPGEVVVVDGDASYTWAADRLTCSHLSYAVPILWTQGFHVTSCDRRVVLAGRYVEVDVPLGRLTRRTDRVWLVAETLGAILGTGSTSQSLDLPVMSPTYAWLRAHGFTDVAVRVARLHVYAVLLVRHERPTT